MQNQSRRYANSYTNFNRVYLRMAEKLCLQDVIEKEQINYIVYELGVPLECLLNHVMANYYEEYGCSILSGNLFCNDCNKLENVLFDHKTFSFQTMSFVHTTEISEKSTSLPVLIITLVYVMDKWLIISYGNILNKLVFYNGNTFEDIFNKSWGYNGLSILPKNQCHLFSKSLKCIVENTDGGFIYLMSYYKQDHFCFVNKKLKLLFCDNEKKLSNFQLYFSYPLSDYLEENELWNVNNNFKQRVNRTNLKRLCVKLQLSSSMNNISLLLTSCNSLRSALSKAVDLDISDLINPQLISYQKQN